MKVYEGSNDEEKVNKQFEKFLVLLSHFRMDMLPYFTAFSEFIYEINDEGVEYFFEDLEILMVDRFKGLKR